MMKLVAATAGAILASTPLCPPAQATWWGPNYGQTCAKVCGNHGGPVNLGNYHVPGSANGAVEKSTLFICRAWFDNYPAPRAGYDALNPGTGEPICVAAGNNKQFNVTRFDCLCGN